LPQRLRREFFRRALRKRFAHGVSARAGSSSSVRVVPLAHSVE
jgi:hypothetical protein